MNQIIQKIDLPCQNIIGLEILLDSIAILPANKSIWHISLKSINNI